MKSIVHNRGVAFLAFAFLAFCVARGWSQSDTHRVELGRRASAPATQTRGMNNNLLASLRPADGAPGFQALTPSAAHAPADRCWVSLGPDGGTVMSVAIDPHNPSIVYAGTDMNSVFKSIDGGTTWSATNWGLQGKYVFVLAIDPNTPTTLYAGTLDGVFRSRDGGNSWTLANTGVTSREVMALAIDPTAPRTLYAGVHGAGTSTSGGVYKSTDGGDTWRHVTAGVPSRWMLQVTTLAIDPRTPATIYAGTAYDGVLKSTDGGRTWSTANNGLSNLYLRSLRIDPQNPANLYAGGGGGIFKSNDGGNSWKGIGWGGAFGPIAINPQNPAIVYAGGYAGIYMSTDAGANWKNVTMMDAFDLAVDPHTPTTVYAASSNGPLRSTDGGTTWNIANRGLTVLNTVSLAVDPKDAATLYAGHDGAGLFKSIDRGANWKAINTGLTNPRVPTIEIDPQNPATVYAGTGGSGIFKSMDGGTTWNDLKSGLDFIRSLALDPQDPRTVYASSGGISRSTDSGNTWTSLSTTPGVPDAVWSMAIDPTATRTLYAGTSARGVLKSKDGGGGWSPANTGLPDGDVRALAIDPTATQIIYAGISPPQGCGGCGPGGVFRSADGGNTWSPANTGLTSTDVTALAIDPAATQILYAGTYGGGVFRSTNAGNDWTSINTGLAFPLINDLKIDNQSPQNLYAATEGGSVWGYSMPPISSTDIDLAADSIAEARTVGSNEVTQAGYAKVAVKSGEAPYGTAVFSFQQNGVTVSETGVPASPPSTRARLFIDYRSGVPGHGDAGTVDVDTGIAIVNYGPLTANITYTLRDIKGTRIAGGRGTLAAGAHFAKFIGQLKDVASGFNLPQDFPTTTGVGSLEISSDQPVSVIALRETLNQRHDPLVTTTPIADLVQPPATDPIYFPQFVDGGGYTTALVLLNTSTAVETGTLQIFDDSGAPLAVNQVGGTTDSSFKYSIPVGGVFRFQTDGFPASAKAGWVLLMPDAGTSTPVGAGVFSYGSWGILVSESGIPAAASTTHARVYVDLSPGHDTGLAIANPTSTSTNVTIKAYRTDGVTAVGTSQGPIQLPGNGHSARFATEFIAGLPAGFTGVLDITSATAFAALTLRSLNNERNDFLMTTFPVADANHTAPSPVVFPQIADGGGFVTEFILLNAGGASKTTLTFFDNEGRQLAVGK